MLPLTAHQAGCIVRLQDHQDYSTTMLNLDRQNAYRARYQATHPGWQTSGQVYESFVRRYAGQHWDAIHLTSSAG